MSEEPHRSHGAAKTSRISTDTSVSRNCELSLRQWDALSTLHSYSFSNIIGYQQHHDKLIILIFVLKTY